MGFRIGQSRIEFYSYHKSKIPNPKSAIESLQYTAADRLLDFW